MKSKISKPEASRELKQLLSMKIRGPGLEWGPDLAVKLQKRRERIDYLENWLRWYDGAGRVNFEKANNKRSAAAAAKKIADHAKWVLDGAKESAKRAREWKKEQEERIKALPRR